MADKKKGSTQNELRNGLQQLIVQGIREEARKRNIDDGNFHKDHEYRALYYVADDFADQFSRKIVAFLDRVGNF